jgi:ArsR family transcriptional regulator
VRPPASAGPANLERAAALFRALGDAARLRILEVLAGGEHCVTEIVGALNDKFPTVSQRLRLLRGEGLVRRRREGNHLFYSLADRHVADLVHNALAHAAELTPHAGVGRGHTKKESNEP